MGEASADEFVIRVIRPSDIGAVIALDAKVSGRERHEYYERKFAQALGRVQHIATSLIAEHEGKPVGFIMGDLYLGEFGIPETSATVDTIGVDPKFQRKGVASTLMREFCSNMKEAGVERIVTQVEWDDWDILRFFHNHGFEPSRLVSLELRM
jgi:ribosomal protein S18 acetylase RimI-like enzyme